MGTLFDQDPRGYRRIDTTTSMLSLAWLSRCRNTMLLLRLSRLNVLELRRKMVWGDNGNIFDEQMAGIGRILTDIDSSIENLK